MTCYSATKTFANFLGEGLAYELQGKIDVLSWQSSAVKTKLFHDAVPEENRKLSGGNMDIISTDVAVKDIFKQIGHESRTAGNWRHCIQRRAFLAAPYWVVQPYIWWMCK